MLILYLVINTSMWNYSLIKNNHIFNPNHSTSGQLILVTIHSTLTYSLSYRVCEIAKLFKFYANGCAIDTIALKAAMMMPALFLQSASKTLNARADIAHLESHLKFRKREKMTTCSGGTCKSLSYWSELLSKVLALKRTSWLVLPKGWWKKVELKLYPEESITNSLQYSYNNIHSL